MRKKEQLLWDAMRRALKRELWMERVENVVVAGMPDIYIAACGGKSRWVEMKAVVRPKRDTTRYLGDEGLNVDQINWHLLAAKKQVRSYVLVRDDHKDLRMVSGAHAATLNDLSIIEFDKLAVARSWPEVLKELIR